MKTGLTVLAILFAIANLQAQNFGTEWVSSSQTYYKVEISTPGVYKVDKAALQAAGMNTNAIDPRKIQVYNKGIEQSIYFEGEADGSFDNADFFYFLAEQNKGELDSSMYTLTSDQPHTYYSLVTDTNVYFITEGTSNGKRITPVSGTSLAGSTEAHLEASSFLLLNSTYHKGRIISGRSYRSDYTEAEGWFGQKIGKGTSKTYSLMVDDLYTLAQPPKIELGLYGLSNDYVVTGNNHHAFIHISPDNSSFRQVGNERYSGYTNQYLSYNLSNTDVGATSIYVKVEIATDLLVSKDDNALGYAKLNYCRGLNIGGTKVEFSFTGQNASAGSSRLDFTNYTGATPLLFDLTNNRLISGTKSGTNFQVMVPGAGTKKEMLLLDATDVQNLGSTQIKPVVFNSNITNNAAYLIVAHRSLATSATAYKNYRSSSAGGAYNTLLIFTDELYNHFSYGVKHPIAIRNFVRYMNNHAGTDPGYLLLLGKGMNTLVARDSRQMNKNLVPTMGVVGSDNLLTYNIEGQGFSPALAIGRVSASSNQEIMNYLNKVMAYESTPDAQWQKEIFSASGGNNIPEMVTFGSFVDSLNVNLEKDILGAKTEKYDLDRSSPISVNPKTLLIGKVDSGILLYHYFGHGTTFGAAVEVGTPQEYNNQGKYPFMFFGGCNIGDAFDTGSIGEDFISADQRGAIGWLAQSSLGYPTFLFNVGKIFTRRFATDDYGDSFGEIIRKTLVEFEGTSDLSVIHVQQHTYQGDPAIKPYAFSKPDYTINANDIYIVDDLACNRPTQITLAIPVQNLGRLTSDSVELDVSRTLADGTVINYGTQSHAPIAYKDTIYWQISTLERPISGTNIFRISIDPANNIDELIESNNIGQITYSAPLHRAIPASPTNYAIVNSTSLNLEGQDLNLLANGVSYRIELDTTYLFNSPYKISRTVNGSYARPSTNVSLLSSDSTVYYWRIKVDTATEWCLSSFTYINNGNNGWNQSHFGQFVKAELNNISRDDNARDFEFQKHCGVVTARMNRYLSSAYNLGIRMDNTLFTGGSSCGAYARVARFGGRTIKPFTYTACNTRNSKPMAVQTAAGRTELKNFIRSLPNGEYFAMVNILQGAQYLKLDSVDQYLEMVGGSATLINALGPQHAYAIVGQKGMSPGNASEDSSYSQSSIDEPVASAEAEICGYWFSGCIKSEIIGPASAWTQLSWDLSDKDASDQVTFNVYGVKPNGREKLMMANISTGPVSLAGISASTYPKLRIEACFFDQTDHSLPNLNRWTVTYSKLPETAIIVDNTYRFPLLTDTLKGSDTLELNYKIKNLSSLNSDSLVLRYLLRDSVNGQNLTEIFKTTVAPLNSGASRVVIFKHPVAGLSGFNSLQVSALPQNPNREEFVENNYLVENFNVEGQGASTPVELLSFTGRLISNSLVNLNWETSQEINNDYFEVQRRHESEDAFSVIGTVKGNGTISFLSEYQFQDNIEPLASGKIFYRLRQVDFDGSSELTNVVTIIRSNRLADAINVYPNPARDNLNLSIWLKDQVAGQIRIYSLEGKELYKAQIQSPAYGELRSYQIPLNTFEQGVYLLNIQYGAEEHNTRVAIIK